MNNKYKNRFDWIWPAIIDIETSKKASRQGFWAAAYCSGATVLLVILNQLNIQILDLSLWALLDASIFALIAWGIDRMSRTASVFGIALYIFERIDMWSQYGPKNPVMAIIITLMFIHSIRGTFLYHKFIKERGQAKIINDIIHDVPLEENNSIEKQKELFDKGICPQCGNAIDKSMTKCFGCDFDFYERGLVK